RRDRLSAVEYDTFLFTRDTDRWEYSLANGDYDVTVCIGDSGHEQPGQRVAVEDEIVVDNKHTDAGSFHIAKTTAKVRDGRLTLSIGQRGDTNTCLVWLVVAPAK
ncbi:MAG: hypothetical protein MI757_19095, partial [Pirellulales bacterium]|nr:hypothetical protein [Pirellulales bacterium]